MKTFCAVLANSLAASVTNNFVWFAITFWVYLQTKSVIANQKILKVVLIRCTRERPHAGFARHSQTPDHRVNPQIRRRRIIFRPAAAVAVPPQ
jgi:hypothetical protein